MTHTPFDVKKVVVVWSSVYTTTIRIVSQVSFVQRYMNFNGQYVRNLL